MDWTALLQSLGLPTVAVVALSYVCWKLISRLLNNADVDRAVFKDSMSKMAVAVSELSTSVNNHEQNDSTQHDKILESLGRIERRNE